VSSGVRDPRLFLYRATWYLYEQRYTFCQGLLSDMKPTCAVCSRCSYSTALSRVAQKRICNLQHGDLGKYPGRSDIRTTRNGVRLGLMIIAHSFKIHTMRR
jgi:hypothetical protein